MRLIAIPLAVVTTACALLYVGQSGGSASTDAALYRHYYAMGKRDCRGIFDIQPQSLPGVTWYASGPPSITLKGPTKGVPRKYRTAARAGCLSDAGGP